MGQREFTEFAIQRKSVHAVAQGQHQHGAGAINGIARANLFRAGPQKICRSRIEAIGTTQHRENRADGDIYVDVGRAVERIEDQQISTGLLLVGDGIKVIHFLRHQCGKIPRTFRKIDHDLVRNHVHLFLLFTLDIDRIAIA